MGLFDWFRRRGPTPAPSSSSVEQPPQVPFLAKVASFVPGDGLGTLSAAGVAALKFGRSACLGFEPFIGVTVEVTAVSSHPLGGFRATELHLKMDASAYDAALVARDTSLGIHHEAPDPVEAAAATCEALAWIIVLLNEAPPRGPAAFAEWAKKLDGVRVRTDGGLRLGSGKYDATVWVGDGPFPEQRLAQFGAPDGFEAGQGFIGLGLGLPGAAALMRATDPGFEAWAEGGMLRELSKLAAELSRHGPGVLLPQAGVALDADLFRGRLGDLSDPTCRPFGAWVATSMDSARNAYSSYGMGVQALPDVEVTYASAERWELDRAREAVLVACATMVHENRELTDGERITATIGQAIGAHPLRPMEGDTETYLVGRVDGRVQLTRETDARAGWARSPPRVALNTYQRMLDGAYEAGFDAEQFTGFTPELPEGIPGFEVEVRESKAGFFMTSNGVGRVEQRFGSAEQRNVHVELVTAMKAHHPMIANLIATVAAHIHTQSSPAEVFKSGDTVGVPFAEIGAAGFVLASAGSVVIAEGPEIELLELVPLTKAELEGARLYGSRDVLSTLGKMTPQSRAERWRLKLVN